MAEVTLTGFIQGHNPETGNGRDPELKRTQAGKPYLVFTIVEPHSKPDGNGGYTKTGDTYRNCIIWGPDAERWANIPPRTRVKVTGIEQTEYFEKQDGSRGQSFKMTVQAMGLVESRNQQGGGQAPAQAQHNAQNQHWGGNIQPQGNQPPQGQPNDPWIQHGGGQYDWGAPAEDTPPF